MLIEVELDREFVHLSMEHVEPANDGRVRHRATVKIPRERLAKVGFAIRCLGGGEEEEEEESIDLGDGELIVSQTRCKP